MQHDAISSSLSLKLGIVDDLAARGLPVRATVFTGASDISDRRIRLAPGVIDLVGDREFARADVHVFEFGVHYPGFDVVYLLPPDVPTLGVFHNITPPEVVPPEARPVIERSLMQRQNLFELDHVLCDSELNRDDLLRIGMPSERLSVLHLPPAAAPAPRSAWWERERRRTADVMLLYIGRLVRAKGVPDLIEALTLHREALGGVKVVMAGNPLLSEQEVIADIRRAADGILSGILRLEERPGGRRLAGLYAAADALVLPSHHEGYGVPVIEALAAGCFVLASDAGNLPHIVGDCGKLVPTGDVDALGAALVGLVEDIRSSRNGGSLPAPGAPSAEEWRERAAVHVARHSHDEYERGFLSALTGVLDRRRGGAPSWLAAAGMQEVDVPGGRR